MISAEADCKMITALSGQGLITNSLCCLFNHHFFVLFVFPDAISNAAYLCEQFYCASPGVEISECNGKQ